MKELRAHKIKAALFLREIFTKFLQLLSHAYIEQWHGYLYFPCLLILLASFCAPKLLPKAPMTQDLVGELPEPPVQVTHKCHLPPCRSYRRWKSRRDLNNSHCHDKIRSSTMLPRRLSIQCDILRRPAATEKY